MTAQMALLKVAVAIDFHASKINKHQRKLDALDAQYKRLLAEIEREEDGGSDAGDTGIQDTQSPSTG